MKRSPLLTALLFISLWGYSQSGLYVANTGTFTIKANTVVAIDGLVLTPSSNYTITGSTSLIRNTTLTHPSITPAIKRVFYWSVPLPAFSGTIGIFYNDWELNGLLESELTLNLYDAATWQAYKTGVSRNATTNFVTTPVSGVGFSELALAAEAHPLPLQWGTLSARRINAGGLVEWQTHHEVRTAYFQVERSMDGIHWSPIGSTVPAMNTPGVHPYAYVDADITSLKTFYRIQQVDVDGQASYSAVTWIAALHAQASIFIYPNPATQQLFIRSEGAPLQSLSVFDASGKLVRIENMPCVNFYALPITSLPVGTYSLHVQFTDGSHQQLRFIKN